MTRTPPPGLITANRAGCDICRQPLQERPTSLCNDCLSKWRLGGSWLRPDGLAIIGIIGALIWIWGYNVGLRETQQHTDRRAAEMQSVGVTAVESEVRP